jgi:small-conductance mechanosensitive channel
MTEQFKKVKWAIIKKMVTPLVIFLTYFAGYIFYRMRVQPFISADLDRDFKKYISTLCIIVVTFFIQRIAGAFISWYGQNVSVKTRTELDDKLIPLADRVIKVAIWVIALIVILPLYGVNISALIATLGVTSLAVALAAQDTIANIIAGFLIMIDAPFRIGDRIKLPSGEIVRVLDIEVRRSTFLSEDKKTIIIVPNLDLSKSKIANFTYAEEKAK